MWSSQHLNYSNYSDCDFPPDTLNSNLFQLICLNVLGIKSNVDYISYLISRFSNSYPLVICISEHWLYSVFLKNNFLNFDYYIESVIDEPVLVPSSIRGKGGAAILWSTSISPHVSCVKVPANDRIVGIQIRSLYISPVVRVVLIHSKGLWMNLIRLSIYILMRPLSLPVISMLILALMLVILKNKALSCCVISGS